MRPETQAAIGVVQEALSLAAREASTVETTLKDGRDVVTSTDVAIEDLICTRLEARFDYRVVGEERGGEPPADGSPHWLVDPICGTRNFASGTALYCINLALVENGSVAAAVVGDPSRGEVVFAERGNGAWALADGRTGPLKVSDASRTLVIEEGKSKGLRREHAARFLAEVVRADRWDVRSLGTTLALAYLAAGRLSAYAVFQVSAVHSAAGSLIVSEAGGVLSDLDGETWTLRSGSLLFSASESLHQELLRLSEGSRP